MSLIKCGGKDCNRISEWPVNWVLFIQDGVDFYLCPECRKVYCESIPEVSNGVD